MVTNEVAYLALKIAHCQGCGKDRTGECEVKNKARANWKRQDVEAFICELAAHLIDPVAVKHGIIKYKDSNQFFWKDYTARSYFEAYFKDIDVSSFAKVKVRAYRYQPGRGRYFVGTDAEQQAARAPFGEYMTT